MRNKIVEEARKYLGVPWRHQGRAATGIDCCGLVIRVANDMGLSDYDTDAYARRTTGLKFMRHFLDAGMVRKDLSEVKIGDVVLTQDHSFPCHCGFVGERYGRLTFIHAYARRKKVVEDYLADWLPKAVWALEFPGISNE